MAEHGCKVGIVSMHMIFEPVFDGWLYGVQDEIEEELKGRDGYETEEVMLYDEENPPPSFFRMAMSEDARNRFVANYNEAALFRKIGDAVKRLKAKGCDHVVLAGESLGAVFALKFVESHPEIEIAGVAGWYPHIDYPDVVKKAGKKPPDYAHLKVPTILFFGADEDIVVKGEDGIERIREIDRENPNLVARIYDKPHSHWDVGHAFFTQTAGGLIRNPYYDKAAADLSWKHFINWLEGFRHE